MTIAIIGTDPAGLYLASLLKHRRPGRDVVIFDAGLTDRSEAVPHCLSNPVKPMLVLGDAQIRARLDARVMHTRGIVVDRDGERLESPGHTYAYVSAAGLAGLLRAEAEAAGVRFVSGPVDGGRISALGAIVVIADGAESPTRGAMGEAFGPQLRASSLRHVVMAVGGGVARPEIALRRTPAGVIHAFLVPDAEGAGRLVVEATAATLAAAGLEGASRETIAARIAELFAGPLAGRSLVPLSAGWRPFASVVNGTWVAGNVVLLGASAYTAHHSVGLGARSGLEDAEALATLLDGDGSLEETLKRHEAVRRPRAESLGRASAQSLTWFETARRYAGMALPQLAYSCLTRSLRVNHETMRGLAPELVASVEALIANAPLAGGPGAAAASTTKPAPPPMFVPITLRGLTIPNRIAMSPMCMYNAIDQDGTVGDFHLVHYGSRAVGGAGLVITEMTDVSPEGRISAYCAGLYKSEHVAAWRRVTDFIHAKTPAKIGVQLGHAGRKGGEPRPWDRTGPRGPHWQTIAPSPLALAPGGVPPREMDRADMIRLVEAYARGARMADEAGFDLIELHFAHGYLLSTFISPLSNKRTDDYGGSLANRLRFPMEVFEAVRAAWPHDKPTSVRISAYDWMEGGTTIDDAIEIGRRLRDAGNDILSVSTGGVMGVRPPTGRLYQATFSDQIRNERLGITTMNVGAMASHGDINAMIAAGRADMVAMARGHLFDPYFTRHAAFQQGYDGLGWPEEYERGPTLRMHDF